MKSFIYLYPIPEYLNLEISWGADRMSSKTKKEREAKFKDNYGFLLNKCIDERYRKNDFQINWAVFNHHEISDVFEVKKEDRIIQVGMDFDTHCMQRPDKSYRYPDNDYILEQVGKVNHLRLAGFHVFDCVEKLASRACERGIDALIDEDLTQFFRFRMFDRDFKTEIYLPRDISRMEEFIRESFINARKGKPYFLQDYS